MEQKNVTDAPQYKCHKIVRAAKVIGWKDTDQGPVFELDGGLADYPAKVGWNEGMVGGYLVVYDDGYTSYSPAKAFEEGYAPLAELATSLIGFGDAIQAMKDGRKVARAGWNGKGMFIALMPGFTIPAAMINERTKKFVSRADQDLPCGGYIVMWTAQGVWQPGWLASQADMLAEDWEVVS